MTDETREETQGGDVPVASETPAPPVIVEQWVVTTPEQWRAVSRDVWRLKLPSGNVIRARRPDIAELYISGVLDAEQLAMIGEGLNLRNDFERVRAVAYAVLPGAIETPQVVVSTESPGPGAIRVDEIPTSDLIHLMLWALGSPNAIVQQPELSQ